MGISLSKAKKDQERQKPLFVSDIGLATALLKSVNPLRFTPMIN
jgi:hypothetical protein